MPPSSPVGPADVVAERLRARGESVAVAESATGGLIAAALVAVPGASAYFTGGIVVYTLDGARDLLAGGPVLPDAQRSCTGPFAAWLAAAAASRMGADWAIGETGAAGPTGNPYGDPAGLGWAAVHRRDGGATTTRRIATGSADRPANMERFAANALTLLAEALVAAERS
ncbi:MAG: CinA family protein [Solirubrobacteraceae bacterium]|nr:CinA family protein [Solirubrobacteraceae bacterium]